MFQLLWGRGESAGHGSPRRNGVAEDTRRLPVNVISVIGKILRTAHISPAMRELLKGTSNDELCTGALYGPSPAVLTLAYLTYT